MADYLRLGFDFHDYDKRLSATWKFLRGATAEQVTAQVTRIFEADNRLVSGTILRRLLDPAPRFNEWQHTCYPIWSGDGMVPPANLGKVFDGNHTHFLTSGSAHIDSADIEDMIRHVTEHGYGRLGSQGGRLILAHPNQVEDMTFWRAGVEYATGKTPKFDYVPSAAQPAYFTTEHLVGAIPPSDFNGLQVLGSYGDAWLIESHYVPAGYVIVAATGGLDEDMNVVGFREHENFGLPRTTPYSGSRTLPNNRIVLCQGVWRRRSASRGSRSHAGNRKRQLHGTNHPNVGAEP